MEEFLIGAGLALLLALLAWSDSISNLHKDTLELEKDFSDKRGLNLRKIRTVIRSTITAPERITALHNVISSATLKEHVDVGIINELCVLDSDRRSLENLYRVKYRFLVVLTHLFLISGTINYFLDDSCSFTIIGFSIKAEFLPIISCLLFLYLNLIFTTRLNKLENDYKAQLNNLMDKI